MPPKANRQPKRAVDSAPNPNTRQLGVIDRVHLPALKDTPSSRRQYSYGAAVEPMAPRRLAGDYADQPYTLDNAIKSALERQARDLEEERRNFPRPEQPRPMPSPARQSKSRSRKTTRGPDQDDELASAAFPPPRKADVIASSEADDARSFGIESDVYGDATIASAPDVTSEAAPTPGQRSVNRRDARRRAMRGTTDPVFRDTGSDESSGDELGVRRSTRNRKQSAKATETEQDKQSERTRAAHNLTNGALKDIPLPTSNRLSSSSPETLSKTTAQGLSPDQLFSKKPSPKSLARFAQVKRFETEQRQRLSKNEAEAGASRQHAAQATEEESYSDRSEQDSALQEDIQAREDALSSERGGEDDRHLWQQRWDYMQSLSPSNYLRRRYRQVPVTHEGEDEDVVEGSSTEGWRRFCSLHTYLNAFARLLSWVSEVSSIVWRSTVRHAPRLYKAVAFISTLVLLAVLPSIWQLGQVDDLFNEHSRGFFGSLESLRPLADSISSIIPAITRPFRNNFEDRLDLADFDEHGKFQLEAFLRKYDEQLKHIKNAGYLHTQAIRKLEAVVPNIVHMEMNDGKPIVSQKFWHALREFIQDDDGIFTIQDDGQLSQRQWKLVSSRILEDAGLESKLSTSVSGAETRMEQKITSLWDTWVKENDGKLHAMLGESVEKIQSLGTDQELNVRIARIIKEQSKANAPADSVVVTRDEFLRRLKNEFVEHRSEIKAELNELQPRVEQLVLKTIERYGLNKNEAARLSNAARAEVSAVVNKAISDALANANLNALARGKIQHHWDLILKNHINHFSMGSGAIVNPGHSSATYDPFGKGVVDRQDLKNGIRGARLWHHSEALMGWSEDGDKWCAARGVNLEGKPYGYMLAVQLAQPVVPQHIVVEHILPGATIDPDARPRDIEVYAQIEDPEVRSRVLDFSATHIDQTFETEGAAPLREGMVRIGRFTYAGAEVHDGVYVHELSSELIRLGAETTEVVIRAVNNYGAPDHTCFYRVRMYGQAGEGEVVVEEPKADKSFWKRVSDYLQ